MSERLSGSTVRGTIAYVVGYLLLAVSYLVASPPLLHGWGWGLGLVWLLLAALRAGEFRWYEVTVTAGSVQLRRLFGLPVRYALADFVDLRPTTGGRRPLRLSFADGRSFLFQPRLKASSFSLRYTPREEFAAWWRAELAGRATRPPADAPTPPAGRW